MIRIKRIIILLTSVTYGITFLHPRVKQAFSNAEQISIISSRQSSQEFSSGLNLKTVGAQQTPFDAMTANFPMMNEILKLNTFVWVGREFWQHSRCKPQPGMSRVWTRQDRVTSTLTSTNQGRHWGGILCVCFTNSSTQTRHSKAEGC